MFKVKYFIISQLVVLLTLTSCATIFKDPAVYGDLSLKDDAVGYIVLYRKYHLAAVAQTFIISLDDKEIAALKVKNYCVYAITPGRHNLSLDFSGNLESINAPIEIKKGEIIFVKIDIPYFSIKITTVDRTTALSEIKSLSPIRDVDRDFLDSVIGGYNFGLKKEELSQAEVESKKRYDIGENYVGNIQSISSNEVIVSGNNISEKVKMGDSLCLYSPDDKIILLEATFPMMTVVKCKVVSGKISDIQKGLKVYKYYKQISEKKEIR